MKVTNNAYELLWGKLNEIEQMANNGILQTNSRDCCLEIKSLVSDARQIMRQEFYVPELQEIKI
ncbi:MAG: hypothetical protein P1P59_04250 [Treponemataceae bacterium]